MHILRDYGEGFQVRSVFEEIIGGMGKEPLMVLIGASVFLSWSEKGMHWELQPQQGC